MTLIAAHELGLALTQCFAMLAVLLGGELPPWLWLALPAPPLGAALAWRRRRLPLWVGTTVAALGMGVAALWMWRAGSSAAVPAATSGLCVITAGRALSRRTASHDAQVMVLALLLLFAGTVLHQSVTYGLTFVLFAIAATQALLTRQLLAGSAREAAYASSKQAAAALYESLSTRRMVTWRFVAAGAAVALCMMLMSVVAFALFPRVGGGALGMLGRAKVGLPDDLSLFAAPRASIASGVVVARLRGLSRADFERGLYLRGRVFDSPTATGGFMASPEVNGLHRASLWQYAATKPRDYEIYLQPIGGTILPALGPVQHATMLTLGMPRLDPNPWGELQAPSASAAPVRYRVLGPLAQPVDALPAALQSQPFDAAFSAHFLRLPEGLDGRIVPLAQHIVGAAPSALLRVAALRNYLQNHMQYALAQPNGGKADPLAAFLFDDKRGHCEYFAAAQAIMLRAVGIPSRVVGGFAGGAWDDAGDVVRFTGNHAHAWVEWFAPGIGWVTDDATPGPDRAELQGVEAGLERLRRLWDDKVVQFGLQDQMDLLGSIGQSFSTPRLQGPKLPWHRRLPPAVRALVVAFIGLSLMALWRRLLRARRSDACLQLLLAALAKLRGTAVPDSMTLREACGDVCARPLAASTRALLEEALHACESRAFAPTAARLASPSLRALRKLARSGRGP